LFFFLQVKDAESNGKGKEGKDDRSLLSDI